MKKLLFFTILATTITCKSAQEIVPTQRLDIFDFKKTITVEGLRADLTVISGDSMKGRETGSSGIEKTAQYLAERYQALGLTPMGDEGTYFQEFSLVGLRTAGFEYEVGLKSGQTVYKSTFNTTESGNFITVNNTREPSEGPIVFTGTGAYDAEKNINHFPENVKGKWLFLFYDTNSTNDRYLSDLVTQKDAAGAIVIENPLSEEDFQLEAQSARIIFNHTGNLVLEKGLKTGSMNRINMVINQINPVYAASLLGLNNLEELKQFKNEILKNPEEFKAKDLPYTHSYKPIHADKQVISKNVAALIMGEDPIKKKEVVILSAHYDHLGALKPDSTEDKIYNGADDNGTGTSALLSIAQAIITAKHAGVGPDRSILFLHVSGEEIGLLGSQYYAENPLISLENTSVNLNVDMIGRVDKEHLETPNYVYTIGGKLVSGDLDSLVQVANNSGELLKLNDRYNSLDDPNQYFRRSDHWNFGKKGIPFVFYFGGTHADYHKPSDEVDKIEWSIYLNRTQLIYSSTVLLANTETTLSIANDHPIRDFAN